MVARKISMGKEALDVSQLWELETSGWAFLSFRKPGPRRSRPLIFQFHLDLGLRPAMVFSARLRQKLLRGTTYAASGVAVLGLGQVAKLRWQYECPGEPLGQRHGHAGGAFQGKPLKLLFVGDSIAVGVGAQVAAPLQAACAARLAKLQRRPVEWRTIAANGADVRELHELLEPAGAHGAELGAGSCMELLNQIGCESWNCHIR
eukprot:Skav209354  [mRNA]  locus=scaffold241:715913:721514:- [translate_table: standard]